MGDPILEFHRVSKIYGTLEGRERFALRDVSVRIAAGSRIAVTGRSGSGKSTLLHLAAGIDTPTRGEVVLLGRNLADATEAERTRIRRDGVGLVFQFFYLLAHLSVRDNVLLPRWIAGETDRSGDRRADELLAKVGLADRAADPVHRLSGGEMQRVAICRALLRRPRLLLADEPTGNLDDDSSRLVMDLLLALAAGERSALVYVTHSRELAALADERWTLHSGTLSRSSPGDGI